jgi:Na+-driven multidrug efflux pump
MIFKNIKTYSQLFLIFLTVFLEYSITTIDFLFLEKISYLATIGVASLISLIYMIQRIITLFVSAMIDNSLYHYANLDKNYKDSLFVSFILTILLAIIVSILFFYYKNFILSFFKINPKAKEFALIYINYMIPFLIIYGIQQFFSYLLYTLKLAKLNLFIIFGIIIFNFIFNYVSNILNYGVKGIAIASNLAIICSIPFYLWILYKNNVYLFKFINLNKTYFRIATKGIKNIGIASIFEPILIQGVDVIIKILIVSFVAQEALSARVHSGNFFTLALSFSVSLGIILQIILTKNLAIKDTDGANKLYQQFLKIGVLTILTIVGLIYLLITHYVNDVSSNLSVANYILVIAIFSLIIEPSRLLSVVSKSYVKALQRGNLVLIITFCVKLFLVYPMMYIFLKIYNFGLYGILSVEIINYLINFILYSFAIKYFSKKSKLIENKIVI